MAALILAADTATAITSSALTLAVGLIVGVVASRSTRKTEHGKWFRQHAFDAYAGMIGASMEAQQALQDGRLSALTGTDVGFPLPALIGAHAHVEVYGSDAAIELSEGLHRALGKLLGAFVRTRTQELQAEFEATVEAIAAMGGRPHVDTKSESDLYDRISTLIESGQGVLAAMQRLPEETAVSSALSAFIVQVRSEARSANSNPVRRRASLG